MSYPAYKGYRLAPDDNGCVSVLTGNYEQVAIYPSTAAAKRAVDELVAEALTHPNPKDPQADIAEMMGWYGRDGGWFQPQAPDHWNKNNDLDVTNVMSGLLALFQAREQQMLTELLGELPKKKGLTGNKFPDKSWNKCIDQVVEVIERLQNKTNDGGSNGDSNITTH